MIKNGKQYKMTKSHFNNFKLTLSKLNKEKDTPLIQLEKKAIQSQMIDLQREMDEYNDLKSSMIPVELNSIDELPIALIKARISLGFSQKELGNLIGVHEQQIQRYESTNYETASIAKIKKIAKIFNFEIEKNIKTSSQNFSKKLFNDRIQELGIEPSFLKKYLLPASLSASFDNPDIPLELLSYQVAYHIGRIFKFEPAKFFSSEPLVLDPTALSNVQFKTPVNVNTSKLNIHTVYAKYISHLVSKATQHIVKKKLPNDPFEVHDEILLKYGEINFKTVLDFIWGCGIPILTLDLTTFHAAYFCDGNDKIIVVSQKTSSEARWMFNLLHEFYHASQGNIQIVDGSDSYDENEEQLANQFAGSALLGQNPYDLAKLCLDRSDYQIPRLKQQLKIISEQKNIRADILANYIAYRLTSERDINWWSTSQSFQKLLTNGHNIVQNLLLKNIDFNTLSDTDMGLLKQIFDTEVINLD